MLQRPGGEGRRILQHLVLEAFLLTSSSGLQVETATQRCSFMTRGRFSRSVAGEEEGRRVSERVWKGGGKGEEGEEQEGEENGGKLRVNTASVPCSPALPFVSLHSSPLPSLQSQNEHNPCCNMHKRGDTVFSSTAGWAMGTDSGEGVCACVCARERACLPLVSCVSCLRLCLCLCLCLCRCSCLPALVPASRLESEGMTTLAIESSARISRSR